MNLYKRFHEVATEKEEKQAIVFQNSSLTYKELKDQIMSFSKGLQSLGFKKGDHLAILLGNCPEFVITVYGALQLGVVVIPINPIYTEEEINYILKDSHAKGCILLEQHVPMIEKLDHDLPMIEAYIVHGKQPLSEHVAPSLKTKMKSLTKLYEKNNYEPLQSISEDETAVILYTSGTTGNPKGAMLSHKNVYSNARDIADYLNMNDQERVVCVLPVFHVFSFTVALNAPLMSGATVLLLPRFSPSEVIETIVKEKATIFAGVPTMYNFLYQQEKGTKEDFKSIRFCISGGASLPVALLEKFEERFQVPIYEGYGLSEASPVVCFNPFERTRKPGSIGTAITNVDVKVVRATGEDANFHEVGELVAKGPNVMKGYYNREAETSLVLKEGWLYTGDLAYQDEDGYFFIVDRKKDMINVGGYNVYPREVEEVLYNHPNIIEAAVIGVPDLNYGEAVQCFVVTSDDSMTKQTIVDYCEKHLAKYKIPTIVEFLDELPKNSTGKILRRALRETIIKK